MDDVKSKRIRESEENVASVCNSDDDSYTDTHRVLQLKNQFRISLDSEKSNINMQ